MASEPVFIRYLRELWQHAESLAGSLVVFLVLWALNTLKPAWWERPQLWVYIAIAALGIFIAQYRTWRAALRREEEGPDVRGYLTLEYERPSSVSGGDELEAGVRVKQEVPEGSELHLLCDAPVTGGNGWVGREGPLDQLRIDRQYRGMFRFRRSVPAGSLLEFRIHGTRPIALRKLHLVPPGKKPFF